ncbi:hypothetical protein P4O66_008081, partial [Electrophorus voltai]
MTQESHRRFSSPKPATSLHCQNCHLRKRQLNYYLLKLSIFMGCLSTSCQTSGLNSLVGSGGPFVDCWGQKPACPLASIPNSTARPRELTSTLRCLASSCPSSWS